MCNRREKKKKGGANDEAPPSLFSLCPLKAHMWTHVCAHKICLLGDVSHKTVRVSPHHIRRDRPTVGDGRSWLQSHCDQEEEEEKKKEV